MSRLFVTSTGTDIGKTYVCCRLIEAIRDSVRLRVVKPVASGVDLTALDDTDTGALLRAQGRPVDATQFELATPWHFSAPLSPDMAAAREGRRVPFDELVEFSRRAADADLTIVEGIGGALVPLDERHTVRDWIGAVGGAVWVVAGTYLGSISHTLATLAALEAGGIAVDALVLSESAEPAAPLDELIPVLTRFAGVTPVVGIGRPATAAQIERLVALLPPR